MAEFKKKEIENLTLEEKEFSLKKGLSNTEGDFRNAMVHLEMIISPLPGYEMTIGKNFSDMSGWLTEVNVKMHKERQELSEAIAHFDETKEIRFGDAKKFIRGLNKEIKTHKYPKNYEIDIDRLCKTMIQLLETLQDYEEHVQSRNNKYKLCKKDVMEIASECLISLYPELKNYI